MVPHKIMHLVQGLEVGGLERMVINLVERIDREQFDPAVCCFDVLGGLSERLMVQHVPVTFLPRSPGVDWKYPWRLARLLRTNHVELLHMHNPTAFFYGTLAGSIAHVPCLIYTEHGRDFSSSLKIKLVDRVLACFVDEVVAVADASKRYLLTAEKLPTAKVKTIHNGIDAAHFNASYDRHAIRFSLGLSDEQPVVGIVARLDPIKNHTLLIYAMQQVVAVYPTTALLVVGDGPLRGELVTLASALGLDNHIHFLGTRHDVPELMSAMDLFVLCSHNEGLSLTLVEASASGLPTVATRVGGNEEVVAEGETGFLVADNDGQALAEAMLRILSDQGLRQALGTSARHRFEREFTLDGMIHAYEQLYSDRLPH